MSIDELKIKRATAIYTGGNIYAYYAELENGNWILGGEDFFTIVNSNPLSKDLETEYGRESDYYEWQIAHLVENIADENYNYVLNQIIDTIKDKRTIPEVDNFSLNDLNFRYTN